MDDRSISTAGERGRLRRRLAELEEENERLRTALQQVGRVKGRGTAGGERAEPQRVDNKGHRTHDLAQIVADNAPEPLLLLDKAGRTTFANSAAARVLGWTQDALVGQVLHDMVHPHHAEGRQHPDTDCPLAGMFVSGRARRNQEAVFHRKDGTTVDVICSVGPLIRTGPMPRRVLMLRDITRRQQARALLLESEKRLRLALEAGRLGEWDWDLDRDRATQSPRTYRIYGYEAPFPEFTYDVFMSHVLPEDRQPVDRKIGEAIATRTLLHVACRIRRLDGKQRWIEIYGRRLRSANRMIGVVQDVTERKHAEERQAMLVRELNHRVKNTLAIVQSIANLMMRDGLPPDVFCASFGERLAALAKAQDLLTRGGWKSVSLRSIVRDALAPYGSGKDDRLVITGAKVPVRAETAVALSLVLHELATNAAKYGALSASAGQVHVSWTASPVAERRRLRLEWRESGGPEVAMSRRKGFGSTLIERILPHQVGGEARLDLEPGGARFTMELPLRERAG